MSSPTDSPKQRGFPPGHAPSGWLAAEGASDGPPGSRQGATLRGTGGQPRMGIRPAMEHRCGERVALGIGAVVRTPFAPPLECVVVNIGSGGAFLAVPGRRRVRGLVRISAQVPGGRYSGNWRGFVVHTQPDGVGVMFDEPWAVDLLDLSRQRRHLNGPGPFRQRPGAGTAAAGQVRGTSK